MLTRSIVGRVLILAVLIVSVGVIAQAALIMTQGPTKKNGAAQPGNSVTAAADQQDTAPIRVVYPGPLGDTPAPARKIADAAPASPLPVAASPTALPPLASSSVGAITQASASQEDFDTGEQRAATPTQASAATAAAPSDAEALSPAPISSAVEVASAEPGIPNSPVQSQPTAETSGGKGVNINSASAEALNHLQGGGRIGQSIVQHRPYKSVDELVKKRVLRRAVYDQIKNQIAAQ